MHGVMQCDWSRNLRLVWQVWGMATAQQIGARSRRKGAAFELLVAKAFAEVFDGTKRGIGQARSAKEVSDVEGTTFWIECKHRKDVNVLKALEQARRDTDGRPCLVVWRKHQQSVMVSTDMATFMGTFSDTFPNHNDASTGDALVHMELSQFLGLLKGGWYWS